MTIRSRVASDQRNDGSPLNSSQLKVGDRIRIVSVPGLGVADYKIHADTTRAYKRLIRRTRSVRIGWIDEYGQPWYQFRFKRKDGSWEHHSMCVMKDDDNWVPVHRRKKSRR